MAISLLEVAGKPRLHSIQKLLERTDVHVSELALPVLLHARNEQADGGRIPWMLHDFGERAVVMRHPYAHGHVEYLFAELDQSLHEARAARDYDAGRQQLFVATATELRLNE